MLQYQTVSSDLLSVLRQLMKIPLLQQFRLVGGTGLSLQLGHRKSIDIDLFTDKFFDKGSLRNILINTFDTFELNWESNTGFTSNINNIKVDFFNWSSPFVLPTIIDDNIVLMDKKEIGAMKLEAITSRKDKKDFFDIAFLLEKISLKELLNVFRIKYPFINYKFALESLMTVDLADKSNDPIILSPLTWPEAKKKIISNVESFFAEQTNELKQKQQERLRKAEELLKNKNKDS